MITNSSPAPDFTLTRLNPRSFSRNTSFMYRIPEHLNGSTTQDPDGGYTEFRIPADPLGLGPSLLPFPRPTATSLLIVSGFAVGRNNQGGNPAVFAMPRTPADAPNTSKTRAFNDRSTSYRIAIIAEDPAHLIDTFQFFGRPMGRALTYRWAGNSRFPPTHFYDITDSASMSEINFLDPFQRDVANRKRGRSPGADYRFRLHAGYETEATGMGDSVDRDRFGVSGRPVVHGRRTYAPLAADCTIAPPSIIAPDAFTLRDPFNPARPPVDFITPAAGFGFADLRISREVPAVFLIDIPLTRPDRMTRHITPEHPSFPVPHRRAEDAAFLCAPGAAPFSLTAYDARHRPLFLADPLPLVCTGDPVIDLHVLFHAIPGLALTYLTACAEVAASARKAAHTRQLLPAGGAPDPMNPHLEPAVPAELHQPLAHLLRTVTRTGGGTLPEGLPRDTDPRVLSLLTSGPSAPRPFPLAVTTRTLDEGLAGCPASLAAAQRAGGTTDPAAWQARPMPLMSALDAMAAPLAEHIKREGDTSRGGAGWA